MNPNKIRYLPRECLLNNIIDKDFQAVLLPFALFQKLFLTARFNVTGNFITPKRKTYFIKSTFAAIILIIINYYRFMVYSEILDIVMNKSITLMILLWFDCVYYSITTIIIYIVSAIHSSNTVLLIIKLQQALHTINFKTKMLSHMRIYNWIYILSISSFYLFCTIIIACQSTLEFKFTHLVLFLPVFIFDLNIIYASRTVTFTCNVLGLWNRKMIGYEKKNYQEMEENQLVGKAMLNAYFDIIKSFRLTEKIYQFAITFNAVDVFVHILYNVQSYLEYAKLDILSTSLLSITFAIMWPVKNVLLLISLSFACDKFYRNVEDAEVFCTRIIKLEESDLRKICKNVLRFNRASFRKLSACGVFAVDAALTLRLLAVGLTYTVVLLQFAFL